MSKKVLLIEDDAILLGIYKTKFELAGFTVDTATDGLEGIEKMRETHPDLVFLDIMMPNLNGSEALIEIKKDPSIASIPVVMLTILPEEKEGENSLLHGAVIYLVKSKVKPRDVVAKAKEILGTSDKPYDPSSLAN